MASLKASLSFLFMLSVVCYASDISNIDSADLSGASNVRALFESWRVQNGRLYGAIGEKEKRFEIFKDNLNYIIEQNVQGHPYELGLTKFADLTNDEFIKMYGGRLDPAGSLRENISSGHHLFKAGNAVPDSVDWREQGAVTEVISQGKCGSCWAWATVGAIEGINQIVNGQLIRLSAQELVDCERKSHGCKGGWPTNALEFVVGNGGIVSADDYPYQNSQLECNDTKRMNNKVVSIDAYGTLPKNDEQSLQSKVAEQPVIVSVAAHSRDWQLYKGGIFTALCGPKLSHGIIIIGYGSESGIDYWLVKNTWGTKWGEDGYMRILRNFHKTTGKCGIAMYSYYPIINSSNIHEGVKGSEGISSY